MPKISIITVTYNAANTIKNTLDSILLQDYEDYESIIIDGGSTDGTLDIIKAHELIPSYFISESDDGISDAFNKGILASSGEFIIFLSADDFFYNSHVLNVVSAYLLPDKVDVFSGAVVKENLGEKTLVSKPTKMSKVLSDMIFNHPSMFVKKSALVDVGMFDLDYKLAMDYDLVLKLYLRGYGFFCTNEIITVVSEEGVSHRNYIKSRIEVLKIQRECLTKSKAYLNFMKSIVRYYVRVFLEKVGGKKIVDMYRRYFSINIKKRM